MNAGSRPRSAWPQLAQGPWRQPPARSVRAISSDDVLPTGRCQAAGMSKAETRHQVLLGDEFVHWYEDLKALTTDLRADTSPAAGRGP